MTKLLLDAGADVAAADNNGQTALMLAAHRGHDSDKAVVRPWCRCSSCR